jgi:hypothetical protein
MSIFEDPQSALLRSPVYGVVVGQYLGLHSSGHPLVSFAGQEGSAAIEARTIAVLHGVAFGAEVLLQFDQGDVARPIILGVMQNPQAWTREIAGHSLDVDADGERLQIQAREQLVLRCGDASITLTKAGKILIKGTYLSSRATGTHRIKGGSVQIN